MNKTFDRASLFALLIAVFWIGVLTQTSRGVGMPRDESFYVVAADYAASWFVDVFNGDVDAFSQAEINRRDRFGWNWEHPVLMKSFFGLSKRILHDELGWVSSPLLAYRLPTMFLAGLGMFLVFLLGRRLGGVLTGYLAQGFFAFMPRMFFHSHLACFDMPVTVIWLLVVFTFIKARFDGRWIVPAGVTLGLGFATKLNIFFLPFALLGYAILEILALWRTERTQARWLIRRYAWIGGAFIVIGGAVFFAHWPLLYHDAIGQIRRYIEFHARHVHYPVDYFGVLQYRPPFAIHFPLIMTLVSVPIVTLGLGLVGVSIAVRKCWSARAVQWSEPTVIAGQALVSIVVPLFIIAMPNTPIFGGTKHWMPAMPFLALLAAWGLVHGLRNLPKWMQGRAQKTGLIVLLLSTPLWATHTYGTHGPVYYNGVIGGPPGAADLGLSRNFWGHSTQTILPIINEHAEKSALVFWHKATQRSVRAYKDEQQLRKDVRYTGDWTAAYSDWSVYHTQREKLPEEVDIWRAYGSPWPIGGAYVDGLEIMSVYRRRGPLP